ncbi:hypothetical protein N7G274_007736 [Stereocaulon virgatum]|uniref:Uncharacterized protein n=1 Tax=Stereocaulon virgatum TaxID=373712 RepID=A0ABR4A0J7_9LECA
MAIAHTHEALLGLGILPPYFGDPGRALVKIEVNDSVNTCVILLQARGQEKPEQETQAATLEPRVATDQMS